MGTINTPKSVLKILCLEDTPFDAELIMNKLVHEGYVMQFDVVSTKQDFIDCINSSNFDLILSDYNLPGFSGIAALEIAQKTCPEIPFICVSGAIGEDMAVELLKMGASDYVLKDKLDKLPLAVKRALKEVQKRRELRKSEEELKKLSKAVQQSPAAVVILDTKANIEYINPKFTEITGYTFERVSGKTIKILKEGSTEPEQFNKIWKTISSGFIWSGEFLNKRITGESYWEYIQISSIVNEAGEITNYIVIIEDITERKKLTQELIEAKEMAEESDRLKTAFLQNMSHEIRTPMNGILGFAELLKNPGLTDKKQQEFIKIIENSGKRMLNIINDIIDISKIETNQIVVNIQKTPVNQLLNQLHEFFRIEADVKGLSLVNDAGISDTECFIETDQVKLSQILTNLIKNALKFTDKGSISFGFIHKGSVLEFYVTDTGMGIPSDHKELIFERFRQVDMTNSRIYEGAGLGLSISKAYVEILGGEIWVDSELGKGSTFYFTLPFYRSEKDRYEEPPKIGLIDNENAINILIAEDDEDNRRYFYELFRDENVNLFFAQNGVEAIKLVESTPHLDLVLMDLKMPMMDGYEASRLIKRMRPDLLLIAQTAHALSNDEEKAKQAGCDEYISKPISRELLFKLINKQFAD